MAATTSGTYTFALEVADVIVEAFERCGKTEDSIDVTKLRSARRSMNLLQLKWANLGTNLWAVEKVTFITVESISAYNLDPSTIMVLDAYVTPTGGSDLAITPISRGDYSAIPNKDTEGRPNCYWLDRTITPVMNLWLTPDDLGYVISYYRLRQIQDVTAGYQLPEIPARWYPAMCSGLAAALAEKYAPERYNDLAMRAKDDFHTAAAEDREKVPMYIRPTGGYRL